MNAGKRNGSRQWIIAVVCLTVIGFAAYRLWTGLGPGSLDRGRVAANSPALKSGPDTTRVHDWSVYAVPEAASTSAQHGPQWGPSYRDQVLPAYLDGPVHANYRVDEGNHNVPAIQVHVQITVSAEEGEEPGLWPGADHLQLVRADLPDGPYREIGQLEFSDFPSIMGSRNRPGGPGTSRITWRFYIADNAPAEFRPYFYKVRFLSGRKKLLSESGYCSATPLPIPSATGEVDDQGYLTCRWAVAKGLQDDNSLQPLRMVMRSGAGRHLARTRYGDGTITAPAPLPVQKKKNLHWGLSVESRQVLDCWSDSRDQRQVSGPLSIERAIRAPVSPREAPVPNGPIQVAVGRAGGAGSSQGVVGIRVSTGSGSTPEWWRGREVVEGAVIDEARIDIRRSQLIWRIYPGPAGEVRYTLQKIGVQDTDSPRIELSAVRCPIPSGFRARPGDQEVHLSWDTISLRDEDWDVEPRFVLLRRMTTTQRPAGRKEPLFEQIARLDAGVTSFVDRDVVNDFVYQYVLEIQGISRATSWQHDVGEYPVFIPVRTRSRTWFTGQPIFAQPGAPRSLTVSVLSPASDDVVANAAQANLIRMIDDTPWLELVERSAAGALFEEKRLRNLQDGGGSPDASQPVKVRAADILLHVKPRTVPGGFRLDLWCDILADGTRDRIWSVPYGEIDVQELADAALRRLIGWFPGTDRDVRERDHIACGSIRRVAITGLRKLSESAPEAEGIEELLIASLSGQDCLEMIDRAEIVQILRELGTGSASGGDFALQLGHLVNADAILTGFYGMQDGILSLSAQLIETRTGSLVQRIQSAGSADDLDAIGRDIADGILAATRPRILGTDNPAKRFLEAKIHEDLGEGAEGEGLKAAAVLAPDSPKYYMKLGEAREREGRHAEALSHFYDGMKIGEAKGGAMGFYEAADRVLRKEERTSERISLWARAVEWFQQSNANVPDEVRLRSARTFRDAGQRDKAILQLQAMKTGSFPQAQFFEELGRADLAVVAYVEAEMKGGSYARIGRGHPQPYAALIRLFQGTEDPVAREKIFEFLVSREMSQYPFQKLRAYEEFGGTYAVDDETMLEIAVLSEAVRGLDAAEDLYKQVIESAAEPLQRLKAKEALARSYRKAGRLEECDSLLGDLIKAKGSGHQYDRIRDGAQMRRRMLQNSGKKPSALDRKARKIGPFEVHSGDAVFEVGTPCRISRKDPQSGEDLWSCDLWRGKGLIPGRNPEELHGMSDLELMAVSLVFDGERLYVPGFLNGTIHALNASTGEPEWVYVDWFPVSGPVLSGGMLYASNFRGDGILLDPRNGKVLQTTRFEPGPQDRLYASLYILNFDREKARVRLHDLSKRTSQTRHKEGMQVLGELDARSVGGGSSHGYMLDTLELVDVSRRYKQKKEIKDPLEEALRRIRTLPDRRRQTDFYFYEGLNTISDIHRLEGSERAVPLLLQVAKGWDKYQYFERTTAIRELVQIGGAAVLTELLGLSEDNFFPVRQEIARAVGSVGSVEHMPVLERLLRDDEPKVQRAAAGAVVVLLGTDAKEYFREVLEAGDPALQAEVALYLFLAGDESMRPVLLDTYGNFNFRGDQDEEVRILAALCKAGIPGALVALHDKIRDDHDMKVEEILAVIDQLAPDPSLLPILLHLPDQPDAPSKRRGRSILQISGLSRGTAGDLLASLDDPSAIPYMIRSIGADMPPGNRDDPDPVAPGLSRLTGKHFGNDRAAWEYWWAREGIRSFDPEQVVPPVSPEVLVAMLAIAGLEEDLQTAQRLVDAGVEVEEAVRAVSTRGQYNWKKTVDWLTQLAL